MGLLKISVQLHGLSNASQSGHEGLMFLHVFYEDTSNNTILLTTKTIFPLIPSSNLSYLEPCQCGFVLIVSFQYKMYLVTAGNSEVR